jgi:hypothetical protein
MAVGSTYTPIATQTLGSAAASYTFSSIPSTYTDLVFIANVKPSIAAYMGYGQFNGDTGTNYSETLLYGTGSTAGSARESNRTNLYFGNWTTQNSTSSFTNYIINIMNYANTTTYKTTISREADPNTETNAVVNLWRSTAAINSFTFSLNTGNFLAGSTFTLYGIAAA